MKHVPRPVMVSVTNLVSGRNGSVQGEMISPHRAPTRTRPSDQNKRATKNLTLSIGCCRDKVQSHFFCAPPQPAARPVGWGAYQPSFAGPAADLTNQQTVSQVLTDFRRMVREVKGHPAVLMWAIGNEPNNAQTASSYATGRRATGIGIRLGKWLQ